MMISTQIRQDTFFKDLSGFEKIIINDCEMFKGKDGAFYKVTHCKGMHSYITEYAENELDAKNGIFWDADLFDDDIPEAEIINKVRKALAEYLKQSD